LKRRGRSPIFGRKGAGVRRVVLFITAVVLGFLFLSATALSGA
jgi:hypothetical protein